MLSIVLDRRDFREYDQIITLLTKERGKIEALARGLKKITAKNTSSLEPGSLVEAELVPGKEITHLIKSQAYEIFPTLRSRFETIAYTRILLDLISSLIKGEEQDDRLFELLKSFLFFAENVTHLESITVAGFVLKLCSGLGFTPAYDRCVVCRTQLPVQATYVFDIEEGGVMCTNCLSQKRFDERKPVYSISAQTLLILKKSMTSDWNELNSTAIDEPTQEQFEELVYRFALYHSGQKIPDWRTVRR